MQLQFWDDDDKLKREPPAPRKGRVIRASEIGEYLYCHRAWWLDRVKGAENANRAALDAGVARHRAEGERVIRAERLRRIALVFSAVTIIVAALLILLLLQGH